ncbi:MAG: hypothetical protein J5662_06350 [Clostridia bacterium]|nr:hypothetical protein [Clostridia bacterium]
MRIRLKKLLALTVCLFLFLGALPVNAQESAATEVTLHSFNRYLGPAATAVLAGDINNDGRVNNKDLTRLFQYLSDWEVEVNRATLDTNGDNRVNNKDLTRLFQFLSDWDVEIFPQASQVCEHKNTEKRGEQFATCTQYGYSGDTYCLDCGEKLSDGADILPLGHDYVATVASPTCTEGGFTMYICSRCQNSYVADYTEPCGHCAGDWLFDETEHWHECTFCATTLDREAHNYISITTLGNCTEPGYTTYTCMVCGYSYTDYDIPTSGHEYEITIIPPTCTEWGYTTYTCSICGYSYTDYDSITPALGHTGGIATCHSAAICDRCGTEYGPWDYSNHDGGTEIVGATEPTPTEWGYTGNVICLGCGQVIQQGTYYQDTHIHTGGFATCHSKAICEICGEEYGDFNPDAHTNFVVYGDYPASCTYGGYTGDVYCADCYMLLTPGTYIEPTGHINTEIRGAYPATEYSEGYTGDTYCLDCGMLVAFGQFIPPESSHIHSGGVATCHSRAICDVCGEEYGYYDYNNHDGGTAIVGATEPTDTEPGYSGNEICLGCNEVIDYGNYYNKSHVHMGDPDATYYQPGVCWLCRKQYYAQMSAYDSLNENQQGFYRRLQNMVYFLEMSQVQVTEYCDFNTYEDDIYVALSALSFDRPDMSWIPDVIGIAYSYIPTTGQITDVYITFNLNDSYDVREVYGITERERDNMLSQLDEAVDNIVALASGLNTDFEKEVFVHDYLCEHIYYDYNTAGLTNPYTGEDPDDNYYDPLSFTAYGAIVNGVAVCEGYSRAMQLICQELGIPCGLVTGYANNGPHMWNIINPGDGCYYLDLTFDDIEGYHIPCVHTYFNQTKENMESDHIYDDIYEQGDPLAYYDENDGYWYAIDYNFFETHGDHTALEYYTATGAYIDGTDASLAAAYVLEKYNNGETHTEIKFNSRFGGYRAYIALRNALTGSGVTLDTAYQVYDGNILLVTARGW